MIVLPAAVPLVESTDRSPAVRATAPVVITPPLVFSVALPPRATAPIVIAAAAVDTVTVPLTVVKPAVVSTALVNVVTAPSTLPRVMPDVLLNEVVPVMALP